MCQKKDETLEACSEIHGTTNHDQRPALDGMWCTLINASSPDRMLGYVSQSLKVRKKVLPAVVKKKLRSLKLVQKTFSEALKFCIVEAC